MSAAVMVPGRATSCWMSLDRTPSRSQRAPDRSVRLRLPSNCRRWSSITAVVISENPPEASTSCEAVGLENSTEKPERDPGAPSGRYDAFSLRWFCLRHLLVKVCGAVLSHGWMPLARSRGGMPSPADHGPGPQPRWTPGHGRIEVRQGVWVNVRPAVIGQHQIARGLAADKLRTSRPTTCRRSLRSGTV
jgi:hypothetical protein